MRYFARSFTHALTHSLACSLSVVLPFSRSLTLDTYAYVTDQA